MSLYVERYWCCDGFEILIQALPFVYLPDDTPYQISQAFTTVFTYCKWSNPRSAEGLVIVLCDTLFTGISIIGVLF